MLGYLDTQNALFTRGVTFDLKQYLFVLQVVMGEDKNTAYAMIYDRENFVKETGTEDEQDYLAKFTQDSDNMLQQQECKHLYEYLHDAYTSDVQASASTLKDFKFSGSDVQQLLSNLLHNRSEDLDEASVRDIVSLIKMLYDQGALDSADGFAKHFITIHSKFNALCPSCNHEFDCFAGIDCKCPHCGQVYRWSEAEKRFFPQPAKL